MKISAPESLSDYLAETEHAVMHLYEGLATCTAVYDRARTHWNISKLSGETRQERTDGLDEYLSLAKEYFGLKFSEATFAVAILQVAYAGIRLYSTNANISTECANLVDPGNPTAAKFCIGPKRLGVPTGLIVYAARNQASHWDEPLGADSRSIFNALSAAMEDNPFADLAFDLSNPTIKVYAGEILHLALEWRTYPLYVSGLRAMLGSPGARDQL